MADMLKLRRRMKQKKPAFKRMEHFRFPSLGDSWRKPRGINSKVRTHEKGKPAAVRVGYRMPKAARFAHPSGYMEILVHNVEELHGIDAKKHAVRIAGTVGSRKRAEIMKKCDEMKIRLLNRTVIVEKAKPKAAERAKEESVAKTAKEENKKIEAKKGDAAKETAKKIETGKKAANARKAEAAPAGALPTPVA